MLNATFLIYMFSVRRYEPKIVKFDSYGLPMGGSCAKMPAVKSPKPPPTTEYVGKSQAEKDKEFYYKCRHELNKLAKGGIW